MSIDWQPFLQEALRSLQQYNQQSLQENFREIQRNNQRAQPSLIRRIADEVDLFPNGNLCHSIQQRTGMSPDGIRNWTEVIGLLITFFVLEKAFPDGRMHLVALSLIMLLSSIGAIRILHRYQNR